MKADIPSPLDNLIKSLRTLAETEPTQILVRRLENWVLDNSTIDDLVAWTREHLSVEQCPESAKEWKSFEESVVNEFRGESAGVQMMYFGLTARFRDAKTLEEINVVYRKLLLPEFSLNWWNRTFMKWHQRWG